MFHDAINSTHRYMNHFTENVKEGTFASSFPVDVIEKIIEEETELQKAYDEGQQKTMRIDQLLSELRAMV